MPQKPFTSSENIKRKQNKAEKIDESGFSVLPRKFYFINSASGKVCAGKKLSEKIISCFAFNLDGELRDFLWECVGNLPKQVYN